MSSPRCRAYVTFLAGNGDYVKGVVGLVKSLRKVKSAYPLVVAMLADVPKAHRELLLDQGCIIRDIEQVYPPQNTSSFARQYYIVNYSKLQLWNLTEYSKIVFLDADVGVYENIDHLFDLPDGKFYAVNDCFCEPEWSHSPQFQIGYCQQCPEKVAWSAHKLGPRPSPYFNTGMFVTEPNNETFQKLISMLQDATPTAFAEQDFLNIFFEDIHNGGYVPIPSVYNLIVGMLWRHPENVESDKIKVFHYCSRGAKPWRYTGKETNMDREDVKMWVKKWWDVYNDKSLDYKVTMNKIAEEKDDPVPAKIVIAAKNN